jgi:hypothetical protein
MTIPTGLGLVRGPESADQPGTPIGNRVAFAARNDATAVKGETSDPCYCGCCNMTDRIWT